MHLPAAFGRLCVETTKFVNTLCGPYPAAFGRLCVETSFILFRMLNLNQPPSGGCVLKLDIRLHRTQKKLPAAFGRLCVETASVRQVN